MSRRFLRIGIAGLAVCAAGLAFAPQQVLRSYLFGYLFWMSVGVGCLPILMLYHVVGGGWGHGIRRLLESGTRTIVLLAILFVPILAGMKDIYSWVHPQSEAISQAIGKKALYLNVPFFICRSATFFFL